MVPYRWLTGCLAGGFWLLVLFGLVPVSQAQAASPVQVILDGRSLSLDPPALLEEGRTLVPLRQVFEAMGALVHWDGSSRTVSISQPPQHVLLRVDSPLACLDPACGRAVLLDVPARIREGRTYVPLRFVASALGAGVGWDAGRGAVVIGPQGMAPWVRLQAPEPGAVIGGPATLQLAVGGVEAAGVRYYLLDPQSGVGTLLFLGDEPAAAYTWRPDPALAGQRLLAAAAVDGLGRVVASDAVRVQVQPDPRVQLVGLTPGQRVSEPVSLRIQHGFVATHVQYDLVDPRTGKTTTLGEADPDGSFTWVPQVPQNGEQEVRATAYDRTGKSYSSPVTRVQVAVSPQVQALGVRQDQEIKGPVSLQVRTNFPVERVRFDLQRPAGAVTLAEGASRWVAYPWFPGPDLNGEARLVAVVEDESGQEHRSDPIRLTVNIERSFRLTTVGPNQVLSGSVTLQGVANHPFRAVEFHLVDPARGTHVVIAGGTDPIAAYTWTPAAVHDGQWLLRARATDAEGRLYDSISVPVRVHSGPTFGPQPAMTRDEFLAWAKERAVASYRQTGMSAALQVAQAILETGWGQSMPVDKYDGRPSYNLFGIKGQGTAGSVISNTWEEYDGVVYRVDDRFRAYRGLEESWQDHKELLLTRPWYAPFRAVMADPVQGAWALQRSGYATDSRYPLKLINLMHQHGLYALDLITP